MEYPVGIEFDFSSGFQIFVIYGNVIAVFDQELFKLVQQISFWYKSIICDSLLGVMSDCILEDAGGCFDDASAEDIRIEDCSAEDKTAELFFWLLSGNAEEIRDCAADEASAFP